MSYSPFNGVPCAYHLHYHFCFQTKFSRPRFSLPAAEARLAASLNSICNNKKYHLLGHNVERDKLYCLISLRPDDVVSVIARTLKSNLAREFNLQAANPKGNTSSGEAEVVLRDAIFKNVCVISPKGVFVSEEPDGNQG